MMNPSILALLRRAHDPAFVQHYFAGPGFDFDEVGGCLATHAHLFPRVNRVVTWQGDVMTVPGVEERSFDFVHASQCLQQAVNPGKALARWLDLLKPGGYLVLTVPDEDLARALVQPGENAPDRRASFTICKPAEASPAPVNVLDLVESLSGMASCERVMLMRDHQADEGTATAASSSANSLAEAAIEVVLRRRHVPTPQEFLERANQAQTAEECQRVCEQAVRTYPYRFWVAHRAAVAMLRWNLLDAVQTVWDGTASRLYDDWDPKLYQFLHKIASGHIHEGFKLRAAGVSTWPWRRRTQAEPPSRYPGWTGESLEGKSIVIWSEFGLGDEVFFLRFARMLKRQAGAVKVTVVCQEPLVELFATSGEADAIVAVNQTAELPDHDFWVYPHDIPAYLPLTLDTLPPSVPFLRTSPGMRAFELPGRADAFKVGVVFKGAPTHENDAWRSLSSLDVLMPLFERQEVEFYSLQKGPGAAEVAALAQRLDNFHDVGATVSTMMETARAIDALDLVLTVDTSVAHVAAAMGKPTWLLLPAFPDWRWHYAREDSPWYPSMKLYRHPFRGGWADVIARIGSDLAAWVGARSMNLE